MGGEHTHSRCHPLWLNHDCSIASIDSLEVASFTQGSLAPNWRVQISNHDSGMAPNRQKSNPQAYLSEQNSLRRESKAIIEVTRDLIDLTFYIPRFKALLCDKPASFG